MKKEQEIRMRLNTYKLYRKEKIKKGNFDKIDKVLFDRSINELEWVLE